MIDPSAKRVDELRRVVDGMKSDVVISSSSAWMVDAGGCDVGGGEGEEGGDGEGVSCIGGESVTDSGRV